MSTGSKIEWCDATWNVVTGCTKVSQGCKHCYAERMAMRLQAMGQPHYVNGFHVTLHPDALDLPLHWKTPRRIFVNSMSDLFHPLVPNKFIDSVFAVAALCPQHTFIVLTKRPNRLPDYMAGVADDDSSIIDLMQEIEEAPWWRLRRNSISIDLDDDGGIDNVHLIWPLPNVWMGTSIEDQETADERIPWLLKTTAAVRFVSCEPLLGPINLPRAVPPDDNIWEEVSAMEDVYDDSEPAEFIEECEAELDWINYGNDMVENPEHAEWEKMRLEQAHYLAFKRDISWVIVGGESGPEARPMHPDWARSLRDQCQAAKVPFFFKQNGEWIARGQIGSHGMEMLMYEAGIEAFGGTAHDHVELDGAYLYRTGKKTAGDLLDGKRWHEFP